MLKRTCVSGIKEEEHFIRSQHGVYVANVEYLCCWHGVSCPNQAFSSILTLGSRDEWIIMLKTKIRDN